MNEPLVLNFNKSGVSEFSDIPAIFPPNVVFPGLRRTTCQFFDPSPSRGRPPTQRKLSGSESLSQGCRWSASYLKNISLAPVLSGSKIHAQLGQVPLEVLLPLCSVGCGAECAKPSRSQSLANFVANIHSLCPQPPRVSRWKNFISRPAEFVANFSWNFLRPLFLEIEGRKSAKNFAIFSPHFLAHVGEKFRQNFALGAFRHNHSQGNFLSENEILQFNLQSLANCFAALDSQLSFWDLVARIR